MALRQTDVADDYLLHVRRDEDRAVLHVLRLDGIPVHAVQALILSHLRAVVQWALVCVRVYV